MARSWVKIHHRAPPWEDCKLGNKDVFQKLKFKANRRRQGKTSWTSWASVALRQHGSFRVRWSCPCRWSCRPVQDRSNCQTTRNNTGQYKTIQYISIYYIVTHTHTQDWLKSYFYSTLYAFISLSILLEFYWVLQSASVRKLQWNNSCFESGFMDFSFSFERCFLSASKCCLTSSQRSLTQQRMVLFTVRQCISMMCRHTPEHRQLVCLHKLV